jgi:hypothetical protein
MSRRAEAVTFILKPDLSGADAYLADLSWGIAVAPARRITGEATMKVIVNAVLVVVAAAILQSLPDIARYFRIREM